MGMYFIIKTYSLDNRDIIGFLFQLLYQTTMFTTTIYSLRPGQEIDQIYISNLGDNPSTTPPTISSSPYITIHCQVASVSGGVPSTYLPIYDAINSFEDINSSAWYYFDLSYLGGLFHIPDYTQ